MHGMSAGGTDGKALRRLVVLLLALADLAERAGGRSGAAAHFVLWLLGWAEAVARDHVWVVTGRPLSVTIPAEGSTAICLAESFRAMAAALRALAAAMSLGLRGGRAFCLAPGVMRLLAAAAGPGPAIPWHDSS